MIAQDKQINTKAKRRESLPVNSENEKVNRNCMRLYIYLLSISHMDWKLERRTFSQTDFNLNKIHEALHMHPDTIIKYWEMLEDCRWIKYEGKRNRDLTWKNEFKERKKNKFGSYTLKKDDIYRLIPRETVKLVQEKLQVDENELKMYILLANLQENALYNHQNYRNMTLTDLCDLRQLSARAENKKKIMLELLWLKAIGLVNYSIKKNKNNFGESYSYIHIEDVYYYTNGGEVCNLLSEDIECMTEQMKAEYLTSNRIVEFEGME